MLIPYWKNLADHAEKMRDVKLRELFEQDPQRFNKFSLQSDPLLLDFSKNLITEETHNLLVQLAQDADIEQWRDNMFAGNNINSTEHRAVLHTALRNPGNTKVSSDVEAQLARMEQLCEKLHSEQWLGYKNTPLREIVVIGIGGSYLGPKLGCEALKAFTQKNINVHFLANIDAHALQEVLNEINADETLFVIISKSFTTKETNENSNTLANWLREQSGDSQCIQKQFAAITANKEAAQAFGIAEENILSMWDWVGGRFSLWSAAGFPLALQIGMDNFRDLLAGAYAMDEHFKSAQLDKNLPITLGLLGVWYINFLSMPHHAVLPYDHRLRSLPGYLQQLDMESNGKSVTRKGEEINYVTGPIVFGEAGTNGQHAFHQLLHQGELVVPCDFIGIANAEHEYDHHHEILLANMLAQSQAMMIGRTQDETEALLLDQGESKQTAKELAPHMTFPGNRPSNTILSEILSPYTLGALLAMYEHKIFVQGIIWDINSFDQMGVELGKTLANKILPELRGSLPDNEDSSTKGLLAFLRKSTD